VCECRVDKTGERIGDQNFFYETYGEERDPSAQPLATVARAECIKILLDLPKASGREYRLWTFQKNARARKFYESRGWVLTELTDGLGNEEKEPEVRYVWKPVRD